MGLLGWIIIGGLAGWLASIAMGTNREQGCLLDIALGVVGALVGGFLLNLVGVGGASGVDFSIGSLITAFIGAVVVLFVWKQVAGRR